MIYFIYVYIQYLIPVENCMHLLILFSFFVYQKLQYIIINVTISYWLNLLKKFIRQDYDQINYLTINRSFTFYNNNSLFYYIKSKFEYNYNSKQNLSVFVSLLISLTFLFNNRLNVSFVKSTTQLLVSVAYFSILPEL